MSRIHLIILLTIVLISAPLSILAEAVEAKLPRGAQFLGIATSDGGDVGFDKHIMSELDQLIPLLKQLNSDAAILIETTYPEKKSKNKEQQIMMAFALAEQVQHYLKVKHSLNQEIIISIWDNDSEKPQKPKVRISTYPRDFFEN